jgi:hypothetical protein
MSENQEKSLGKNLGYFDNLIRMNEEKKHKFGELSLVQK